MMPEIQARITQLRRGEVPEGYKMVGRHLAPAEWKVMHMSDIYTERKEPGEETLPILTVSIHSGVSDGALDEDEIGKPVKRMEDKSQYKKAVSGDLVFNMMRAWQGAVGTVRTTGMVSPAYIVATPNNSVDPDFMNHFMRTPLVIETMHSQSYGVTDFRLRLYWDSFAPIKGAFPSIEEQQKIAAILTAQDKVIELKEKLLAEKEQQKKHLMQQLLTGKKRLPGFSGERKFNPLHLYLKESRILGSNGADAQKLTVKLWGKGVQRKKELHLGSKSTSYYRRQAGQLIYSKLDFLNCAFGIIPEELDGFESTLDLPCFDIKNINAQYLLFYITQPWFYKRFGSLANGGRKAKRVSPQEFLDFEILYPPIEEQKAIAEVLSTADRELDLLRQDIEAEQQKKKALMQLLLTGIVRVNHET